MQYNKYSAYLKKRYGEKVYKIPVNLPGTCPNRDGNISAHGCVFCGESGAGFEARESSMPVVMQMKANIDVIEKKYKAHKYIAYFQNYTGTYLPLEMFKTAIQSACIENVVGISVSTRPDCVELPYLDFLKEISDRGYDVEIELGLQSININTLKILRRGHGLADFVAAVKRIQNYGFTICVHLIGNLPWDTEEDFIEAGKLLSVLGINSIKVHSLYVLKNTILGDWYEEDAFDMMPPDAYIDRVIRFLRTIDPNISIQRLFARAPEGETLFCNWDMSWRKLQNQLDHEMLTKGYKQGDLFRRSYESS